MTIGEFIEHNLSEVLDEWENFASSLRPATTDLSREELRGFAEDLIEAIAEDVTAGRIDTSAEHPDAVPTRIRDVVRSHAAERLSEGLTLKELLAEYRALRAAVIRRWRNQLATPGTNELDELTRFNEAIDQALSDTVDWYNEQLEGARDLLNGVLAHDLRNPLGTILVSLEFLLRSNLDSPYIKAATHIRNSAKRMETMINDLLDFTRTRMGSGLPMSPIDADLEPLCREIAGELAAFHPDAHLHLDLSGNLKGYWDPARLEQLVSNLISNAIEHGRRDGTVTLSAFDEDGQVVLQIHNEGTPIPISEQRAIFDPLRTSAFMARTGRGTSGSGIGLGLYICREIVRAHEGTIEVTANHSGNTFTVRLPRGHSPPPNGQ